MATTDDSMDPNEPSVIVLVEYKTLKAKRWRVWGAPDKIFRGANEAQAYAKGLDVSKFMTRLSAWKRMAVIRQVGPGDRPAPAKPPARPPKAG